MLMLKSLFLLLLIFVWNKVVCLSLVKLFRLVLQSRAPNCTLKLQLGKSHAKNRKRKKHFLSVRSPLSFFAAVSMAKKKSFQALMPDDFVEKF
jgi:hypothetical protein